MDPSELAAKMLEWEKNQRAADALGAEIEAEVLKLGKTQVVGKCRVTYRDGTATYDYITPCKNVSAEIQEKHATPQVSTDWKAVAAEVPEVVEKFTSTTFIYNWKDILKEAKIDPVILSKTAPTATIKLDD